MDFDVITPSATDVNTDASTLLLTGFLRPVSPDGGEVVQANLPVSDRIIQPGLSKGDDASLRKGLLHSALGM